MAWARFDDKRHTNSKLVAACVRDPLKGLAANGLDANAITYCAANETDGFVPDGALLVIAPGMGPRQRSPIIDLLIEVGRWSRDDEAAGHWVHDYLDFNQARAEAEKKREVERDKKARQREVAIEKQRKSPRDKDGKYQRVPEGREGVSPGDMGGNPQGTPAAVPTIPTRPDPTQGNSSSSEEPLSRPPAADDDDDRRDQVLRRLAERDLSEREADKGPVRNPEAWLAKAVRQRETDHGDELERLVVEHPDWPVDQLVEALEPEPVSGPYVPSADETAARQRAAAEAFEAERADDDRRAAAADAAIAALTDDERADLRARAEATVTVVGGRRSEVLVVAAMRRLALGEAPEAP